MRGKVCRRLVIFTYKQAWRLGWIMNKNLIIFTDSGDTIIDESTQVFDERGIVTEAEFIPGAGEVLRQLREEGYRIALVADGEWESFQNVYRRNGLSYCFEEWIVSEVVGEQKPDRKSVV